MLNLYKLEIFSTVAATGSFSRAAEQLYLSQPAVSQHIQDLEAGLGVAVFKRGSRGVSLTPAGETLLQYAECILRLVSEAEHAVVNVQTLISGQLRIGATAGASIYLLPGWLQEFYNRYPNLVVSLVTETTTHLVERLTSGQIDVAFVEGDFPAQAAVNAITLQENPSFVVVGPGHPWWGRGEVSIDELTGQRFISRPQDSQTRSWIDLILHEHDIRPTIVAEFDNPEAIKQAVASGLGIAILPQCAIQQSANTIHPLSIRDVALTRTLKLLWPGKAALNPITNAFLLLLSDQYPQLVNLVEPGEGAVFAPGEVDCDNCPEAV